MKKREKIRQNYILDYKTHKTKAFHKNEKTGHCNRKVLPSGNLQVRRKHDTYYLDIREDLGKFLLFLIEKLIVSH